MRVRMWMVIVMVSEMEEVWRAVTAEVIIQ